MKIEVTLLDGAVYKGEFYSITQDRWGLKRKTEATLHMTHLDIGNGDIGEIGIPMRIIKDVIKR